MRGHIMRGLFVGASLGLVSACGGGQGPAPAAVEGTGAALELADAPGVRSAMADVLRAAEAPDAAFEALGARIAEVFAGEPDPQLALARAQMAGLRALVTLDDMRAYARAAQRAGPVFSHRDLPLAGAQSRTAPSPRASLCPETDQGIRTIVYYVNGILTPLETASATTTHLMNRFVLETGYVQGRSDDFTSMHFKTFHNRSGLESILIRVPCGLVGGLWGAVAGVAGLLLPGLSGDWQAIVEAFEEAMSLCTGVAGGVVDVIESTAQFVQQVADTPLDLGGVAALRSLIEQDVLSGKRVIVVAHSQGNYFTELALQGLGVDDQGPLAASVGVVALASPASYPHRGGYGAFQSFTLERDAILLVPGAPGDGGFSNPLSDAATTYSVGVHDVNQSYLRYAQSRVPIVAAMQAMHRSLTNPRESAGQGYLQATLTWDLAGDIDLRVDEPTGEEVYYGDKQGDVGALDRDDIPGTGPENYYVCSRGALVPGLYRIYVNNYGGRTGTRASVTVRAGSQVRTFTQVMDAANGGSRRLQVATVEYGTDGTFSFR